MHPHSIKLHLQAQTLIMVDLLSIKFFVYNIVSCVCTESASYEYNIIIIFEHY